MRRLYSLSPILLLLVSVAMIGSGVQQVWACNDGCSSPLCFIDSGGGCIRWASASSKIMPGEDSQLNETIVQIGNTLYYGAATCSTECGSKGPVGSTDCRTYVSGPYSGPHNYCVGFY
jgi:hypothetical protein